MTDLPYRAIWERETRGGLYGQDRFRTSTWRMDGLYSAACYQIQSEELEDLLSVPLSEAVERNDAERVQRLLSRIDEARDLAHRAFIASAEQEDDRGAA